MAAYNRCHITERYIKATIYNNHIQHNRTEQNSASVVLHFNKPNVMYVLLIITVCWVYIMAYCSNIHVKKYGYIIWATYWQSESLLTLVSLHRMQAASRLASYWGVVVLVWLWLVRCVSKDCPRHQTERSSSSKVSQLKCTASSAAGSAVFLSPVGPLDPHSLKGVYSVMFVCVCVSLCF